MDKLKDKKSKHESFFYYQFYMKMPTLATFTIKSSLSVCWNFSRKSGRCWKIVVLLSSGTALNIPERFSFLFELNTICLCWRIFNNFASCMFSQLCILLNAEVIYRIFAEIIFEETTNFKFASTMVRTLNTILLTTSELFELRVHLKDITNEVQHHRMNQMLISIELY